MNVGGLVYIKTNKSYGRILEDNGSTVTLYGQQEDVLKTDLVYIHEPTSIHKHIFYLYNIAENYNKRILQGIIDLYLVPTPLNKDQTLLKSRIHNVLSSLTLSKLPNLNIGNYADTLTDGAKEIFTWIYTSTNPLKGSDFEVIYGIEESSFVFTGRKLDDIIPLCDLLVRKNCKTPYIVSMIQDPTNPKNSIPGNTNKLVMSEDEEQILTLLDPDNGGSGGSAALTRSFSVSTDSDDGLLLSSLSGANSPPPPSSTGGNFTIPAISTVVKVTPPVTVVPSTASGGIGRMVQGAAKLNAIGRSLLASKSGSQVVASNLGARKAVAPAAATTPSASAAATTPSAAAASQKVIDLRKAAAAAAGSAPVSIAGTTFGGTVRKRRVSNQTRRAR